jgi:hypothetical protein
MLKRTDDDRLSSPATAKGKLQRIVLDLLKEHEHDGALPTSARFLFYELVQRGVLSKDKKGARRPDQNLHDALFDLREAGVVRWDWVADETRSLADYTGDTSITDGVLDRLGSIDLDPWRGKPPLILTESRSLAGVLRSIASDYCCRIAATNGQCGGFLRTDIAPKLKRDDRVIYFGDWDLAGGQIEANTRRVLEQEIGGPLQWERLALTETQVRHYRLPVIVKRDRRYNDERPHQAVETEALKQTVLVRILRRRLDALLPVPLDRVQERAERQRKAVRRLLTRR